MFSKLIIILSISVLLFCTIFSSCDKHGTNPKEEPAWVSLGTELKEATIQCIAVDPLRSSIIYAGTYNGVYVSEDNGKTWVLSNNGLLNHDIKCLAISTTQSDIVYCATWGRGIYCSRDRGQTWGNVQDLSPKLTDYIYLVHGRTDTMWVATSEGPFESFNSGVTWHRRWTGSRRIFTIASLSNNNRVVLMGVFLIGFARSCNEGVTWQYVNSGIRGSSGTYDCALHFEVEPGSSRNVYATSFDGCVYASSDTGGTWQTRFDNLTWQNCIAFRIDPNNADRFYMAMKNGNVYCSADRGATWEIVGAKIENTTITVFSLLPGSKNTLYIGTQDQGIYRYAE